MSEELKPVFTLATTGEAVIGKSNYDFRAEFNKALITQLDEVINITSQFSMQPADCQYVNERLIEIKGVIMDGLS